MKLSIIIPTYNYAYVLSNAINSVLKQLDPLLHELIVVNDGSTDDTERLLKELQQNSVVGFTFYTKPNGGSASARNLGIDKSSGDYLIFLDADDEMEEGALDKITSYLHQNPSTQFLIAGYVSIWPGGEKSKIKLPSELPNEAVLRVKQYLIDKKIPLANGATVIHRSIFLKGKYPEGFRNVEDIPVFAQALASYECRILPEVVLRINKHADSLRHNSIYSQQVGFRIVDEIFESGRLSEQFLDLKKPFYVQRCLSLFRGYYVAEKNDEAKEMFLLAFKADYRVLFKFSYSKKFITMLIKSTIK